jgi:hypothetical protein
MPPHCAAACQYARPLNGEPGAATVRSRLSPGVGAGAACSPFFGRGAASAPEDASSTIMMVSKARQNPLLMPRQ